MEREKMYRMASAMVEVIKVGSTLLGNGPIDTVTYKAVKSAIRFLRTHFTDDQCGRMKMISDQWDKYSVDGIDGNYWLYMEDVKYIYNEFR